MIDISLLLSAATIAVLPVRETGAMHLSLQDSATYPGDDASGAAKLEAEAEAAMREKDLPRARKLLEALLALPTSDHTPRAQELLGMVFERDGKTTEARNVYQAYLANYPEDEGVPRVRQRLAAINQVEASPPLKSKASNGEAAIAPFIVHGMIAQTYLHDISRSEFRDALPATVSTAFDRRVNVHELLNTVSITASGRIGAWRIEAKADASRVAEYRPVILVGANRNEGSYDFVDRLQVEVVESVSGISARFGRQNLYATGPFGRFDGITLGVPITPRWTLEVAAGHPIWSSRQTYVDVSRSFYMLGATARSADGSRHVRFSWFDQRSAGLIDRQAVDIQATINHPRFDALLVVDYDVAFGALNTLYLSFNWKGLAGSNVALTAQQVHYPELATWNAVLGQPVPTLDAVRQVLSPDQLRKAARDRTIVSRSVTSTWSRALGQRWEAILDATVARTTGSPSSFDVPEFPAAGTELFVGGQLIGKSLLQRRDVWQFGLRYAALHRVHVVEADASARLPLGPRLNIVPRIRLARRYDRADQGAQTFAAPSLRIVYRLPGRGEFEAEASKTFIRQNYATARLTGLRIERAFLFHAGYRLRF